MIVGGAQFSPCRTWRYALWRTWNEDDGHIMFVGLNPSTADEKADDPTIRRCIGYAKAWGYGSIYMLNLFALRSTNPLILKSAADPIGPENNRYLLMYAEAAQLVVVAWGTHGSLKNRDEWVTELLRQKISPSALLCLGQTKDGHPRHPLYLRGDIRPFPYWKR